MCSIVSWRSPLSTRDTIDLLPISLLKITLIQLVLIHQRSEHGNAGWQGIHLAHERR